MEVKKIFQARVVQLAKVPTNLGWVPDLIKEVGGKYEFTVIPKPDGLWSAEPKLEFKHGRLGTIVIDTLAMFHDGFVVDTTTSTDNSDAVLSDLVQFLKKKVPTLEESARPFYLSQLEVTLNLGRFAKLLDNIGNQIFQLLTKYEVVGVGPYAVSALHLAQDPLGKIGPKIAAFSIDRRLDVAYAENVFFAQAPLKTPDHKSMLETLEGVLATA